MISISETLRFCTHCRSSMRYLGVSPHTKYLIDFHLFGGITPHQSGRRGGFMVSALDSGSSGPGSGPGRGHCVVFLGKTLYSHGASLHPGV